MTAALLALALSLAGPDSGWVAGPDGVRLYYEKIGNGPTTLIVPGYVSQAIDGGVMDDRSADWARGQVAIAIRRNPTLCGPNPEAGFTWSRLSLSPPPPESRLAFEMLRFAYDDPYEKEIAVLCRRVVG